MVTGGLVSTVGVVVGVVTAGLGSGAVVTCLPRFDLVLTPATCSQIIEQQ